MIEVDVRATADGRLVLLHDDTVDRTTNEIGSLAGFSFQQIRHFNAGNGERIPALEEALDAASNALGVILELKEAGIGARALALVRQRGFGGPVIFASFLWGELTRIREVSRTARIMPLFDKKLPAHPVQKATALQASHVGLCHRTLTPALVDDFHHAGLHVFVYTVNEVSAIRHVGQLQVDGIISDFPDRIRS
jgi:glycerophosphoryl diester phosphodiesterase